MRKLAKAIDAISFIVCLNVATWILSESGVQPLITMSSGFNPTTFAEMLTFAIAGGIACIKIQNPNLLYMFVFWGALGLMWTPIYNIALGFPALLADWGVPLFLSLGLGAIFTFLILLWVFHLMTGRDV